MLALLCSASSSRAEPAPPRRIVSLAPSLTEAVFLLGAQDALVGVTDFCDYPLAAKAISSVGSFSKVNTELLVSLDPDLVILLGEHSGYLSKLRSMSIPVASFRNEQLSDIFDSISKLGELLGKVDQAKKLNDRLFHVRKQIQAKTYATSKVLVIVSGHSAILGSGNFYAAGKASFYEELLKDFKQENAYQGSLVYPNLSLEGVLAIKPDKLVLLFPETVSNPEFLVGKWQKFVKQYNAKIEILYSTQEYMLNPGPRIDQIYFELEPLLSSNDS